MASDKASQFKCMIRPAGSKDPYRQVYFPIEDKHLKDELEIQLINKYELEGEITFWRSEKDPNTGKWIQSQEEITDYTFTVTPNETIFVIYDPSVDVVRGGVAKGARAYNGSGMALGGTAEGGMLTIDGKFGGSGYGGQLIGKHVTGTAGGAMGGPVKGGTAGHSAGGKILRRDPKGITAAHVKDERHGKGAASGMGKK